MGWLQLSLLTAALFGLQYCLFGAYVKKMPIGVAAVTAGTMHVIFLFIAMPLFGAAGTRSDYVEAIGSFKNLS